MNNYTQAGLERLYQAIKAQAEHEFLSALHRDYPSVTEDEEARLLATYRQLEAEAEQRVVMQSRGKQQ